MKKKTQQTVARALAFLIAILMVVSLIAFPSMAGAYEWDAGEPEGNYYIKYKGMTLYEDMNYWCWHWDRFTEEEVREIIERKAYPSGLNLPTKYMDLMDFAPFETPEDAPYFTDYVARFLCTYFPTEDNMYTYAEYRAAERYIAMLALSQDDTNCPGFRDAYNQINAQTGFSLDWCMSTPVIGNLHDFASDISQWGSLLDLAATTDDTLVNNEWYESFVAIQDTAKYALTMGEYRAWRLEYISPSSVTDQGWSFTAWFSTMPEFWNHYRIEHVPMSVCAEYTPDWENTVHLRDLDGLEMSTWEGTQYELPTEQVSPKIDSFLHDKSNLFVTEVPARPETFPEFSVTGGDNDTESPGILDLLTGNDKDNDKEENSPEPVQPPTPVEVEESNKAAMESAGDRNQKIQPPATEERVFGLSDVLTIFWIIFIVVLLAAFFITRGAGNKNNGGKPGWKK